MDMTLSTAYQNSKKLLCFSIDFMIPTCYALANIFIKFDIKEREWDLNSIS